MLLEMIKKQKIDLIIQKDKLPLRHFMNHLAKSHRSFYQAMTKGRIHFILECKYRSPSQGKLREQYPVVTLAQKYASFATAISVLTNKSFFGGSFAHLRRVSQTVQKPVLCKDIIIDPYQVALARLYGADAILLMLSVLDDATYLQCCALAHDLNMGVLTEIYTEEELERAKRLGSKVIGINHRNLNTLVIDNDRITKLVSKLPKDRIIIAESGLTSHRQIHHLAQYVDGFLIGSALSRSDNIELKMRELVFGNVKICGLTTTQDAQFAYKMGASFGGLNFIPSSTRKVSLEQAKIIRDCCDLHFVGIFANYSIPLIINIVKALNLYAVQLHGLENTHYIAELKKSLPPSCQIWLAMNGYTDLPQSLPLFVDKIVLDNMKNGKTGGTGEAFDWSKLKENPLLEHIILAGGISVDNIQCAKKLGTWGIDINSTIEISPGIKSPAKLTQILDLTRLKNDKA